MPTVFSHAVAATAIGAAMITPPRLAVWGLGALCAVLPDLDVVAFAFELPYGRARSSGPLPLPPLRRRTRVGGDSGRGSPTTCRQQQRDPALGLLLRGDGVARAPRRDDLRRFR